MFISKKKIINILAIGLASTPMLANANDLTIYNGTKFISTSRLNNAFCSSDVLGEAGRTRPGKPNTIKDWQLKLACKNHHEDCVAQVYMADSCQGPVISTVLFSVTRGIQSYTPPILGYQVNVVSPFYVQILGGP